MKKDWFLKHLEKIAPNTTNEFIDFLDQYLPSDPLHTEYSDLLFERFCDFPEEVKNVVYIKFLNENNLLTNILPDYSKTIIEAFSKLERK